MEYITKDDYAIAKENGISRKNVYQRYWEYGWEIERAITEPVKKNDPSVWRQWKETCKQNGITNETFNNRLRSGKTPEQAATTPLKKWGN